MDFSKNWLQFYKADVFTNLPFGGNPVAVFPDPGDLTNHEFQQIAREINLSETVFVTPPSIPEASAKLRIFTPTQEIPFAGHPVLGTFYVLGRLNRFPLQEPITHVTYECNIGVFPLELYVLKSNIDRIMMAQPKPEFPEVVNHFEEIVDIARSLGLNKSVITETKYPVEVASTGLPVLIVPVRTLTAVRSISVNHTRINEICERYGANGLLVFTTMTVEDGSTVHTRMFAAPIGIAEDPATGSASGALGAYLVKNKVGTVRPTTEIIVEQGYEMLRPSRIIIQVFSENDLIQEIRVGGQVVMVAEGKMVY